MSVSHQSVRKIAIIPSKSLNIIEEKWIEFREAGAFVGSGRSVSTEATRLVKNKFTIICKVFPTPWMTNFTKWLWLPLLTRSKFTQYDLPKTKVLSHALKFSTLNFLNNGCWCPLSRDHFLVVAHGCINCRAVWMTEWEPRRESTHIPTERENVSVVLIKLP